MNAYETKAALVRQAQQAFMDRMFAATSGNLSVYVRVTLIFLLSCW